RRGKARWSFCCTASQSSGTAGETRSNPSPRRDSERVVRADHYRFFRRFLRDARPAYTPDEIARYVEAWSQPGAATGMINYYRSSVRQSQKEAAAKLRPISAPTLVIWGERDSYLGSKLAEPDRDD